MSLASIYNNVLIIVVIFSQTSMAYTRFRSRIFMKVSSESTRWEDSKELIALNHKNYLKVLDKYVAEFPKRNVLMIYGAKSIGKSRQIMGKVEEWSREKRLVVDISLKGQQISSEELLKSFIREYIRGKIKIDEADDFNKVMINAMVLFFQYSNSSSACVNSFKAAVESQSPSKNLSDNDHTICLAEYDLLNVAVNNIMNELNKQEMKFNISKKILLFLEILEKEASMGNAPILSIREIQKLVDDSMTIMNNPQEIQDIFHTLFTYFEQYKEGQRNISVIIESTEYLWNDLQRYVTSSPQSFKTYEVLPWSQEEGYQELVHKYKIFTEEEYEKVWSTVGGHAGELFDLHSNLRAGFTLSEAIQLKKESMTNMLIAIIEATTGPDYEELIKKNVPETIALNKVIKNRCNVLKQLKNNNFSLNQKDISSKYMFTVNYLYRSNILWIVRGVITPLHKALENSINDYVKNDISSYPIFGFILNFIQRLLIKKENSNTKKIGTTTKKKKKSASR